MKSASPPIASCSIWKNRCSQAPIYTERSFATLYICMDLYEQWKGGLSFAKWVKYLITDMRLSKMFKVSSLSEVEHRVKDLGDQRERTYTTSQSDDGLADGTTFQSYN